MTWPKPEKRAPRPKKRIARGKRPNRVRKTSRAKLGKKADDLFSLIVRHPGVCLAIGRLEGHSCGGGLQCAHVVSRRYRSTRWDFDNAVPLCAGAHRYFTDRQCEWDVFVERYIMQPADYDVLRYVRALKPWDKDLESVLVRLAERAVSMGIEAK